MSSAGPPFAIEPIRPDHVARMAGLDASAPLLALAPNLRRAFRIRSHLAPGLVMLGAEIGLDAGEAAIFGVDRASATGTGLSEAAAACSLLGETAEILGSFERPGDVLDTPPSIADGWIAGLIESAGVAPVDLVSIAASDASDGSAVSLPADIALRRLPSRRVLLPPFALSAGCAAGATRDEAALRAMLELVERDALALWWYGDAPPGSADAAAIHPAALAALRQGAGGRVTRLAEITTDLLVPAFVAISWDEESGLGIAIGAAARLDPAEAAAAALRELCQMELAAPMARLKAEQGGPLNAADRRHLYRAEVGAAACRFHPLARPDSPPRLRIDDARALAALLQLHRIRVLLADLTRAVSGPPVMRAVASRLQPLTDQIGTHRLVARRRREDRHAAPFPPM